MPALPKRPCTYPGGCSVLVEQGRCAEHQLQRQRLRGKTADRGYGADHKHLRIPCFRRDEWRCVDCGWEPPLVKLFRETAMGTPPTDQIMEELRRAYAAGERHLHADHNIPIETRPDLRLVLDNYRTRCDVCHNAKTAREDGGFGRVGFSKS